MSVAERDEIERGLRASVAEGMLEIVGEQDGEPVFSLTGAGKAHVERLLDAAIDLHGDDAADVFAERMEIPLWMAEDMVEHRKESRG